MKSRPSRLAEQSALDVLGAQPLARVGHERLRQRGRERQVVVGQDLAARPALSV